MAGWPRHDPSRLGGLGTWTRRMCWSCPWPSSSPGGGSCGLGPLPLHGLVFGPLSVNLPNLGWTPSGGTCPPNPCLFRAAWLFVAKWFSGQTPNRAFLSPHVTYVMAAGFRVDGTDCAAQQRCRRFPQSLGLAGLVHCIILLLLAEWFRQNLARRRSRCLLVPLSVVIVRTPWSVTRATISAREQAIGS